MTAEIVDAAARLPAGSAMPLPDAIQLATARAGGAEAFLTNDRSVAGADRPFPSLSSASWSAPEVCPDVRRGVRVHDDGYVIDREHEAQAIGPGVGGRLRGPGVPFAKAAFFAGEVDMRFGVGLPSGRPRWKLSIQRDEVLAPARV